MSIVNCRASCALVPPKAEEEFGKRTPWDSVTKLEWVYKKAGKSIHTRRRMIWALSAITDLVRCKMVTPGELSIGGLSGVKRGGRGMLDLVLLKLDLLDALLVHQADKVGLSADSKCKLRTVFDSHASYREHLGDGMDMTWMSTMSQSARLFITNVEARLPNHGPASVRATFVCNALACCDLNMAGSRLWHEA